MEQRLHSTAASTDKPSTSSSAAAGTRSHGFEDTGELISTTTTSSMNTFDKDEPSLSIGGRGDTKKKVR